MCSLSLLHFFPHVIYHVKHITTLYAPIKDALTSIHSHPPKQKFGSDETFENGVFLGPLGHLTFKGPCATKDKQLSFDVHTMYIGLGPWRFSLPLKKDGKPLSQVDPK